MKKKKLFKNKTQMIVYLLLYVICIGLFIYIGNMNLKEDSKTEALKFTSLYKEVPEDNLYVFADATDVLNVINGRSGIVLFAFPQNKWSHYMANYLNSVAKDFNVDKIYYYDFLSDRDESNGTYETIVNKLNVYVPYNDEGVADIEAPTVLIVRNGNIISYYDDTSIMKGSTTPADYYSENQIALTKTVLASAIEEYLKTGD